ncbi:MAG: hypothetical protein ACRD30_05595 [Bryobacteraceae bacterium]
MQRLASALESGSKALVFFELYRPEFIASSIDLRSRPMLNHRALQFQKIEQLPLKASGKIDYEALQARP